MLRYLLTCTIVILIACSTMPDLLTASFNQRVLVATTMVEDVRTISDSLLLSKKISIPEAKMIEAQANTARQAINLAVKAHAANPTIAESNLETTFKSLNTLKDYLITKGHQ